MVLNKLLNFNIFMVSDMKKLINSPEDYVDECLEGMVNAEPMVFKIEGETKRVLCKAQMDKGKVGVVSGGGFGHIPVFAGYVGDGLLDACAVGDVFSSPDMNPMLESIKLANSGEGVVCVIGNYGGDVLNFQLATEFAEAEGIKVSQVIVNDDIASASKNEIEKRRGVAGLVFAIKIAGAASSQSYSLEKVTDVTKLAIDNTRSIGVALSSCTVPQAGKPTFEISEKEIEIGMGIHGEPGVWRGNLKPANEIIDELYDRINDDFKLNKGDKIALMVNGLGATPIEELYILFRRLNQKLTQDGIIQKKTLVGNYATSMEMAGFSLSVMKLNSELEELINLPAQNPFWKN